MMSKIGRFLVERHWDVVKVVFPSSVLFGFVYTYNYGTSPIQDAKHAVIGPSSSSHADVLSIRLTGAQRGA